MTDDDDQLPRCSKCALYIEQTLVEALNGEASTVWAEQGTEDWVCSNDGEEHTPGEFVMSPKRALDLAIFALNTFAHPAASNDEDVDSLDREGDIAVTVLANLRSWVEAQGEDLVL